jgi:hypothetical protein
MNNKGKVPYKQRNEQLFYYDEIYIYGLKASSEPQTSLSLEVIRSNNFMNSGRQPRLFKLLEYNKANTVFEKYFHHCISLSFLLVPTSSPVSGPMNCKPKMF